MRKPLQQTQFPLNETREMQTAIGLEGPLLQTLEVEITSVTYCFVIL